MRVGANYPWRDYGWDFGHAPPSWRTPGASPRWRAEIDDHLHYFRSLGITVIRWFIMADGLTYGRGDDAPRQPAHGEGWRFEPPPIDEAFLSHFGALLDRFAQANANASPAIRLLPVFLDFHFCRSGTLPLGTPDWVKGGRAEVITDEAKRHAFLDHSLEPLLRVSSTYADTIFAWELINEPEWVTSGWHPDGRSDHAVRADAMKGFLEDGVGRVRMGGFKSTIGFASRETLRAAAIATDINQFHHYPGGRTRLHAHAGEDDSPGIIGEFATSPSDRWPEFGRRDQGLLNRLRLAEAQGYALAIPWSFRATDRHTRWSPAVERDLQAFAQQAADRSRGA